jgi:glutathione S-transferase
MGIGLHRENDLIKSLIENCKFKNSPSFRLNGDSLVTATSGSGIPERMKQFTEIPLITAFKDSPDRGRGLARDFRVRWALEEVDQEYNVKLVTFDEMRQDSYRQLQPFSQIPAYQEGDLVIFESGAIVLHIAERKSGLLPTKEVVRKSAISWMFSALNTIEPPIIERETCGYFERDKSWHKERSSLMDDRVLNRLKPLSHHLKNKDWLDGEFSAGDLMMVSVLRRIQGSELLDHFQNLKDYIARAEARPAYQRAFAAQLEVYVNKERS